MRKQAPAQPSRLRAFLLSLAITQIAAGLGTGMFAHDAAAVAAEVVGQATQLKPEAGARLQGKTRILAVGDDLHRSEQVWTTRGARLDIKFADGSSVTLGENARMVLDEFVVPQGGGSGSLALRSITGALRFVGFVVMQSKPGATRIVTPLATLTAHGAEFFSGPIDGNYGVFVFHGQVDVATSGGSVTLKEGEGTTLTKSSLAPTPPKLWGNAKIARAEKLVGY